MKTSRWKNPLHILLGLVLLVGLCLVTASAAETQTTACPGHKLLGNAATGKYYCVNDANEYHTDCPVNFPDQTFRKQMNQTYGSYLTGDEIKQTTSFTFQNHRDIRGIELFGYLTNLTVTGQSISDLDLRGLTKLKYLYLQTHYLKTLDVTGLTNLVRLNHDNYGRGKLTSLKGLDDLTKLQYLNFSLHSNTRTEHDLSKMYNLTYLGLDCGGNDSFKMTSYDKLTKCYISDAVIDSMDLSGATGLQECVIADCHVDGDLIINSDVLKKFQFHCYDMDKMGRIERLQVSSKSLSEILLHNIDLDVLDLRNCPNLTSADLGTMPLTTLDIRGLDKLESLNHRGGLYSRVPKAKEVSDTSPGFRHSGNKALDTLCLYENKNLEQIYLYDFPALEKFAANQMPKLSTFILSGKKTLDSLTLRDNPNLLLVSLTDLTNLRTLDVSYNKRLGTLMLDGMSCLATLELYQTPGVDKLDLTDCWSIEKVSAGKTYRVDDGTLINPVFPSGNSSKLTGWKLDGTDVSGQSIQVNTKKETYNRSVFDSPYTVKYWFENEGRYSPSEKYTYYPSYLHVAKQGPDNTIVGYSLTLDTKVHWPGNMDFAVGDKIVIQPNDPRLDKDGVLNLYAVYGREYTVGFIRDGGYVYKHTDLFMKQGEHSFQYTLPGNALPNGNLAVTDPKGVLAFWKYYEGKDETYYKPGQTVTLTGNASFYPVAAYPADKVSVHVNSPVAGATPQSAQIPEEVTYPQYSFSPTGDYTKFDPDSYLGYWQVKNSSGNYIKMAQGATFEAGKSYKYTFEVIASRYAYFDSSTKLFSTDGKAEIAQIYTNSEGRSVMQVYCFYDAQEAPHVDITIDRPMYGQSVETANDFTLLSNIPSVKSDVTWYNADTDQPVTGTFDKNTPYYAKITLLSKLNAGYPDDLYVSINGSAAEFQRNPIFGPDGNLQANRELVIKTTPVYTGKFVLDFTIAPPAAGQSGKTKPVIEGNEMSDTLCSTTDIKWQVLDQSGQYVDFTGTFIEGMTVYAHFKTNLIHSSLYGYTSGGRSLVDVLVNGESPFEFIPSGRKATIRAELTVPRSFAVHFDANGGTGQMGPHYVTQGKVYTLPENCFAPPAGMVFHHWLMNGEVYLPGESITLEEDLTVQAVWADTVLYGTCETGKVTVTVENFSGDATLIVAQYKGGQMLSTQMQSVTDSGEYAFPQLKHSTGFTYKAMLVNSQTYAPFCSAETF